jgi:hypothetical protein
VLTPDNQNQVLGKVVSIIRDIWCWKNTETRNGALCFSPPSFLEYAKIRI